MKNYRLILPILLPFFIIACSGNKPNQTANVAPPVHQDFTVQETYGQAFDVGDEVYGVDETIEMLEKADTVDVVLEANVESVCKVKGCWMNLVDTKDPSEDDAFFVKFVDYGFFMPLESEGYRVLVKGKAYKEVTSVAELQHYAEDEGQSPEEIAKITEPAEELKILSSGVYRIKAE